MYNVKGPSKIVAKTTRRGISQNVDNIREQSKSKGLDVEEEAKDMSASKPIFHNKKSYNQYHFRQEVVSPQHKELIKFVSDSWNSVCSELNQKSGDCETNNNKCDRIMYYEEDASAYLENFKPFDLELYWGRRLYTLITQAEAANNGTNHK